MIGRAAATASLLLLIAAPAGSAVAAEPSLAITISNGVDEARPGDTLEYTATISNDAAEAFEALVIITPPAYLTLSDGSAEGVAATWTVSIPAGESREIRTTATVGEGIGDEYQVVVTAAVAAAAAPLEVLVRAADADRIPDTQAPPPVNGMTRVDTPSPSVWALAAAGALVVLLAVVGLLGWLRWRRRHAKSRARGRRRA